MRTFPTSGGWDKKISLVDHKWDEINKWKKISVSFIVSESGGQHDIDVWADDNNKWHFHSEVTRTEGGTPIVYNGETVNMCYWFQDEDDAAHFKLVWG